MSNPKVRTIKRAAEAAGSESALAEALGVTPEDVARWLAGKAAAADSVYLAALDIVARGGVSKRSGAKRC